MLQELGDFGEFGGPGGPEEEREEKNPDLPRAGATVETGGEKRGFSDLGALLEFIERDMSCREMPVSLAGDETGDVVISGTIDSTDGIALGS